MSKSDSFEKIVCRYALHSIYRRVDKSAKSIECKWILSAVKVSACQKKIFFNVWKNYSPLTLFHKSNSYLLIFLYIDR